MTLVVNQVPPCHVQSTPEPGGSGSWLPEGLAALLRDVPTDWLRYVLPGLAGRAAEAVAAAQALAQAASNAAGPSEDHAAGGSAAVDGKDPADRAASSSGASTSGRAGGLL